MSMLPISVNLQKRIDNRESWGRLDMGYNIPDRSDVDIAVSGGDFDSFYWAVKEKIHSLLSFDIIEWNAGVSKELEKEIEKDGVVIYEKT